MQSNTKFSTVCRSISALCNLNNHSSSPFLPILHHSSAFFCIFCILQLFLYFSLIFIFFILLCIYLKLNIFTLQLLSIKYLLSFTLLLHPKSYELIVYLIFGLGIWRSDCRWINCFQLNSDALQSLIYQKLTELSQDFWCSN